jgi:biotin transporter BioY
MGYLLGYLFVAAFIGAWTAWLADRHGRHFWTYFAFTVLFPVSAVVSVPYLLLTRPAEE